MQKRTEITIETERFLVVSQRRKKPILWCIQCDSDAPMLTVVEAARTACTTPLVIAELADAGKLHFVITLEGQQFICSDSLASARA
jgi:6-phosphogluconolactonase (cycloisomerase 2 family)